MPDSKEENKSTDNSDTPSNTDDSTENRVERRYAYSPDGNISGTGDSTEAAKKDLARKLKEQKNG